MKQWLGMTVYALAGLLIAGCSPHEVNPTPKNAVTPPPTFSTVTERSSNKTDGSPWYRTFNDAALTTLIETAYQQNFDVKRTMAQLQQARAIAKRSGADIYPSLDLEVDAQRNYRERGTTTNLQAGATFTWEVDLFDRLENAALSSALEAEARAEDVAALRLTLGAEIATAYYGAVAARERLALLEKQVGVERRYLELTTLRFNSGIGTSLEVLQQKSQLAQRESQMPPVRVELKQYENRLAVLVGSAPGAFTAASDGLLDVPMPVAVEVPSQLLTYRPDLQAQMYRLTAADADIAVAVAQRLPSLTLGAGVYYSETGNYSGPLGVLSAALLQPLLDWNAREAEEERTRAVYEEQIAAYAAGYLVALEEVENALYGEAQQRHYIARLEARLEVLKQTVEEAEAQYLQGVIDYLQVLDALEELHEVERTLISAKYDLVNYRVTLYRALGSDTALDPLKEPKS